MDQEMTPLLFADAHGRCGNAQDPTMECVCNLSLHSAVPGLLLDASRVFWCEEIPLVFSNSPFFFATVSVCGGGFCACVRVTCGS